MKTTKTMSVRISPFQVAWHERYTRSGGHSFIMVRCRHKGGDRLFLFDGHRVRCLTQPRALLTVPHLGRWDGGPQRWGWSEITALLEFTP